MISLRRLLLTAALGVSVGTSALAQCDTSTDGFLLDWNDESWAQESLSGSSSAPRTDTSSSETMGVDISFSGDTGYFLNTYPLIDNIFTGGYGNSTETLAYAVDFSSSTQSVFLTIIFDEPVENLSFEIFDVDSLDPGRRSSGFRDGLTIEGSGPSGIVWPSSISTNSPTSVYLGSPYADNVALGYYYNAENDEADGTIQVDFDEAVDEIEIEYTNDVDPNDTTPAQQGVGLYDLSFCVSRVAVLEATKTVSIFSETSAGCDVIPGTPDEDAQFALPGACIEYRISATNTGTGVADDLTLSDTLNGNLLFVQASQSGFGSGGSGFGLLTPSLYQDCSGGNCEIILSDAALDPGDTGEITIRALLK